VARGSSPNWIESEEIGDTSTLAWVKSVLGNLIKPATTKLSSYEKKEDEIV
jgi:transcription-repair coupling factor (superfamily II helicase)